MLWAESDVVGGVAEGGQPDVMRSLKTDKNSDKIITVQLVRCIDYNLEILQE